MKRLLAFGAAAVVAFAAVGATAQDAPAITGQKAEAGAEDSQKTGVILLTPAEGQVFTVDEDGRIYEKRGYKGVVPGVRDQAEIPGRAPAPVASADEEVPILINWIGFQPYEAFSRVFIQLSGEFEFSVTRPDPLRIEVLLPGAMPGTKNDMNGLITRWFPTNVDRVEVAMVPSSETLPSGGIQVGVFLKKAVGFLYRREGGYVFVDVETKVEP